MGQIEAKELFKLYPVKCRAVNGISLCLKAGERMALRGRPGSGKTVLFRLLAGLEQPSGGQVLIDGQDLWSLSEGERCRVRREKLGMLDADPVFDPQLSVVENVAFPLLLGGTGKNERNRKALEALEAVGFPAALHHYRPSMLTRTQLVWAAVARAVSHSPGILLIDCFQRNLPEDGKAQMEEIVQKIAEERGLTVLYLTDEAGYMRWDSGCILQDGRIKE